MTTTTTSSSSAEQKGAKYPAKTLVDEIQTATLHSNTTHSATTTTTTTSITEKKIRRADRFGIPVQLSEQEKRHSRSHRFGTDSGLNGSDEMKKSEKDKRKARADRFGLEQSVRAEEEKKKARLARFAPVVKVDSVEEEKKKARALRFSESPSSLSGANIKGIGAAIVSIKEGGGM